MCRGVRARSPHHDSVVTFVTVCHYCLHPFTKECQLNEHLPVCSRHEPQQIIYTKDGKNILKFDKFHFQFEVPFAIYADFESVLQKNDNQSDTHVPSGFCAVTTSIFEEHVSK